MKASRHETILEIVKSCQVETQEMLREMLLERGINVTQATLSRDIKDMRLVKELGPKGTYRYSAPAAPEKDDLSPRLKTIFRESLVSYDIAQNLIVLKTLPGLAPACCSALDNMEVEGLVGTLAGDDTAFIAMRDNEAAHRFYHEIEILF